MHVSKLEIVPIVLSVELLCEWVYAVDHINTAVGVDVRCWCDLVAGQVVVTDEVLAWLVYIKAVWQLLSTQQHCKRVSTVVRVVALANLERIIRQVVVHNVWQFVAGGEET